MEALKAKNGTASGPTGLEKVLDSTVMISSIFSATRMGCA